MTRASQSAADKAARMKAAREASQVAPTAAAAIDPTTDPVTGTASPVQGQASATASGQREEALPTVRLSVDLAQPLYDQLDSWMRIAARASGRTRFHRVLVIRALIRELLADAELAERVRRRVRDDMQRGT